MNAREGLSRQFNWLESRCGSPALTHSHTYIGGVTFSKHSATRCCPKHCKEGLLASLLCTFHQWRIHGRAWMPVSQAPHVLGSWDWGHVELGNGQTGCFCYWKEQWMEAWDPSSPLTALGATPLEEHFEKVCPLHTYGCKLCCLDKPIMASWGGDWGQIFLCQRLFPPPSRPQRRLLLKDY